MAAIITDDFRRNSVEFLINDIVDKNTENSPNYGFEYFIGIGKSDPWDTDSAGLAETASNFQVPIPTGSELEAEDVVDNLAGAVAIPTNQAYFLIPRVNWVANRKYKRWNKNDPDMFNVSTVGTETHYPCYAIYDNKIYICLDNNSNALFDATSKTYGIASSQNTPSGTSAARTPVKEADGYIWAYCADLNTTSKFNTDQFVSISQTATGTPADATSATGGMLYGFEIIEPGANASADSTALTSGFKLVVSDSTGKDAVEHAITHTVTSGAVSGIEYTAGTAVTNFEKSIERASIVIDNTSYFGTGTSAPKIRPLIAPKNGFGFNPVEDLPAFYAGLAVNYTGNVEGEISTTISYRQISLIKVEDGSSTRFSDSPSGDNDSPALTGDGSYANDEVLDTLRYFQMGSVSLSDVTQGDIIEQVTNAGGVPTIAPAKAFVDFVDDTKKRVYFHQNSSSSINQGDFTTGDGSTTKIKITDSTGTTTRSAFSSGSAYTSASFTSPEYKIRTGEVLFLENRKAIQRASAQEEEIKLVIQF